MFPKRLIRRLTRLSSPPDPRRYLSQISPQEAAIHDFFGGRMRFKGREPIFDGPLVCLGFTNRSGSNLLGAYLRGCPPLGGFGEDLNPGSVRAHSRQMGSKSLPDFMRDISATLGEGTPLFGFKTSFEQLLMLYRHNIPAMYRGGIKLIEIRRDDVVGQAISYHIALQTGAWSSRIKVAPHPDPVCDPKALHELIFAISAAQARMDVLVECYALDRRIIRYEEMVRAPDPVLHDIGRFLGFSPEGWRAERPPLRRQADATNAAFRATFRRYLMEGAPD